MQIATRIGTGAVASALLVGSLLLTAGSAAAATYEILLGTLTADDGGTETLTGFFDAHASDALNAPDLTVMSVEAFALHAGDASFTPNPPIEFEGLKPILFLELADQIHLIENRVGLVELRAGGDVVDSNEDQVTFRFLDFRHGAPTRGEATGQLEDEPLLPRRLKLVGTLYEVDQTFLIKPGICVLPPIDPEPPGGGGIIVIGGDGGLVLHDDFDLQAGETVEFTRPDGTPILISRVTGGSASIDGELSAGGEALFVVPTALQSSSATVDETPTLDELGITAPDGAIVTFDDTGELVVTSEGDLYVEGTVIDVPGLTRFSLIAAGNITITGTLALPPDVVLYLEAGEELAIDGEIDGTVSVPAPPFIPEPFCVPGLRPVFPAEERAVGHYSLVATAARPIDIEVEPRRRDNRVRLARPYWIPVAVLGAEDLDIRDIDADSLRFGPNEAEPSGRYGRRPTRRGHANRDRLLDLLTRFDVRDTGIAFGDSEVCLLAETHAGETLEGCDAIDTLPPWLRAGGGRAAEAISYPDGKSHRDPRNVQRKHHR